MSNLLYSTHHVPPFQPIAFVTWQLLFLLHFFQPTQSQTTPSLSATVTDCDQAKVIDRESNKMDRWIKEAIYIRKEQAKSMTSMTLLNSEKCTLSEKKKKMKGDEGPINSLMSVTLTSSGERKSTASFRRRQQRLPKRQQQFDSRLFSDEFLQFISVTTTVQRVLTCTVPRLQCCMA